MTDRRKSHHEPFCPICAAFWVGVWVVYSLAWVIWRV